MPTNKPIARNDMNDRVYRTQREKYNAVIDEIELMRTSGRPCLVGTTSVDISELLSRLLKVRKISDHQVLNAKLHQKEADIVARAGQSSPGKVYVCTDGRAFCDKATAQMWQKRIEDAGGQQGEVREEERLLGAVTIATNMAGRGTDIKLSDAVREAGGLAIIGTERHESRRVDRQLRGRAGRQGDVGSSVFFLSLEDKLMRLFASERIASVMDKLGFKEGEMLESKMISSSVERAQKKVEENNFGMRKHLLEYDDVMNQQRTIIYEKRRHALMGERIGMDISNMIWDRCVEFIEKYDYEDCKERFIEVFAMECPFTDKEHHDARRGNTRIADLEERTFQTAMETFHRRINAIASTAYPVIKDLAENPQYDKISIPISDGKYVYNMNFPIREAAETQCKNIVKEFEKMTLLRNIDDAWKENLRLLDELKHSVRNVGYEQKDPLVVYKIESVKLFDKMVNTINDQVVATLMRARIPVKSEA